MNIESKVADKAAEEFETAITEWGKDCSMDIQTVYRDDRLQLTYVLKLFKEGHVRAAWIAARKLDTVVRDVIPKKAWQIMTALGE
jgi:hypothetical protein